MADNIETDMIWVAIASLVIMFWGTPDIHDGIIYKLTGERKWAQSESSESSDDLKEVPIRKRYNSETGEIEDIPGN